ncbi:MAG: VTC domain-containing protein [Lentisphaerota bacterium]
MKFILAALHTESVRTWLDHFCAPDPGFLHNTIHSLYFDTPALESLHEKLNSEYLKRKLRLRWYTHETEGSLSEKAFLEIKRKEGHRSLKKRYALSIDTALLQNDPIRAGGNLDLSSIVSGEEYALVRNMIPFCVIRYLRHRYIDMASGFRVSLDHSIGITHANDRFQVPGGPGHLTWSVLEIKGPSASGLPRMLHGLQAFNLVKTSFSKYAECVNHLLLGKN